jgi:amino acid transporter
VFRVTLDAFRHITRRGVAVASLRKNLGLLGLIAISLAVMGPSMAVSLNPQAIAEQVGGAVPVTFLLAVIPLSIITFSFVILTRRRGSAGSLYGLVGSEIGPRTGTTAGVWLVACYVCFTALTAASFGIFTTTLIQELGGTTSSTLLPLILALAVLPVTGFLAGRTMKTLGHVLLLLEGLTMVAILVVCGLTLAKLMQSGGPQGQSVDWSAFRFDGLSVAPIALALTFALLSSAGFEGAAAAGEETGNPRRSIPIALIVTTAITSAFFIFVTVVGVWAFGTSPSQLEKFSASGSLPADIANAYVADGIGDLITLGGAVSSFACMIGAQLAGGRILFALGRDGVAPRFFGALSVKSTPVRASYALGLAAVALLVFAAAVTALDAFSTFELISDTAGVLVSAAYASACAAAAVVLWRGAHRWLAFIPALGIAILVAVLVLQVFPLPSGWELIAPAIAVCALIGGAYVGRARGNMMREGIPHGVTKNQ